MGYRPYVGNLHCNIPLIVHVLITLWKQAEADNTDNEGDDEGCSYNLCNDGYLTALILCVAIVCALLALTCTAFIVWWFNKLNRQDELRKQLQRKKRYKLFIDLSK